MAISDVFYLHAIKFGSEASITQLVDATPMPGLEEITEYSAGHPEPLFTGHAHAAPEIGFQTPQLKTLLDLIGADWCADTAGYNTDLEYRKGKQHAYRDSGSVNRSLRVTQGLVYLESIRAAHKGQAVASAKLIPTWDGTNDPLIPLGSVALGATSAALEHFTLGAVAINGSQLAGVGEWTFETGARIEAEGSDGNEYPSYAGCDQNATVLTLKSRTLGAWSTLGLDGLAVTSCTFALRRRAPSLINYANGASQHILFTATKGTAGMISTSGGGNAKVDTSLKIRFHAADASTPAIAINTATTLSL